MMSSHVGSSQNLTWPERHSLALWCLLGILTILGFAGWAWYVRAVAVLPPAEGTIHVVGATFGENCGASKDNVLQLVSSACTGKKTCTYVFNWRLLGNPAPTCNKQFRIEWRCSSGGPALTQMTPSDPPQGSLFPLSCE